MNTDNFTGLHSNSLKVRSVFSVFLAGDWLYLFFISAKINVIYLVFCIQWHIILRNQ
ncbi:hypothetical protein SC1083_0376 [Aggregatibacter actinomycetemcomitans serotype e str. SC1083]|uniref:Uncharacterized protein n=1 Tax=Aggregatibacter actinomycetemcomitans serotype e str. SC1083 TaxID=907488 RepID=G4A6D6_AGGAC|nr:hypothetical protein SC1083_0376 [Aggregatibacter actinomycetemcomitans serotype e str. SC1083]KYK74580.1 hypothetical protein SA3096_05090 [Aggregatibacter actinomycetemcomitans serotype e str. SA3096]KYK81450.1 hypothetical protein SC936_03885 [Aggregatibacter actinomycetemcomitans serotype e str. SC936]KYK96493.1 hypothetical protein ANH9776_01270 [Aggregatibacter actinomycetemcomitans serotype e str. ANH9776]